MNNEKTIFSQIMSNIPEREFQADCIIAVSTMLLALTKKKMHMNQSLHTISKNVGLFLTDKTPINELINKTVPEKESTDYYMPSLFGPEDF